MEGYNFPQLLMRAYDLKNYQVGLKAVPRTDDFYGFYDLAMKAPGDGELSMQQLRAMLQTLLADRFKLTVHKETVDVSVFELVVGKNGSKLKAGEADTECKSMIGPKSPADRNYNYAMNSCGISLLVDAVGGLVDKPVVDKTGLTGKFDMNFVATPEFRMRNGVEPGDVSVTDAVQTLGLRLEERKDPIEVLVVDHVEKPSPN